MHLLLLPVPGPDVSKAAFRSCYRPVLRQVLSRISDHKGQEAVSLDIALVRNGISEVQASSRGANFAQSQSWLNQLYTLLAALFTEQNPDAVGDEIDVRVYIVYQSADEGEDELDTDQGPILSFRTLATASRQWTNVFTLRRQQADTILYAFLDARHSMTGLQTFRQHRVAGKLPNQESASSSAQYTLSNSNTPQRYHSSIAVGGTFDHLHLGHKLLLTATALVLDSAKHLSSKPRTLTIGITTTALLLNKAHASVLESWPQRQAAVILYLAPILDLSLTPGSISTSQLSSKTFTNDPEFGNAVHYSFPGNLTVRCVEIEDGYGPTITDESIDALVVSAETRKGGQAVNTKRSEKGWQELDVYEVGVLDAGAGKDNDGQGAEQQDEDFKSKISSTEIRKRLVDNAAKENASS